MMSHSWRVLSDEAWNWVGHLKDADGPNIHQSLKENPQHDTKNPPNIPILLMSSSTIWTLSETSLKQTEPCQRGELSVQWNKHSLWWKHQFWHQRHVWLTCASLANDWIVNETYPSREGRALDKSGFVITAGAVGEARSAQRKGLYFVLSNLFPQGALHLPSNQLLPRRTQHTLLFTFLYLCLSFSFF